MTRPSRRRTTDAAAGERSLLLTLPRERERARSTRSRAWRHDQHVWHVAPPREADAASLRLEFAPAALAPCDVASAARAGGR